MSQQAQLAVQTQQKATDISSIKGNMLQRAAINTPITPVHSGILQRCSGGVECAACREKRLEKEGTLQRAAINAAPTAIPPIVHDVLSSSGQPLDTGTRAFMEPRFGHDFGQVRVHTGARAAESAQAVNALAYTVGRNVVFGAGQYMPGTSEGRRLLAHELTHVVQQDSVSVGSISSSVQMNSYDDASEREAEAIAKQTILSGNFTIPRVSDAIRPNIYCQARLPMVSPRPTSEAVWGFIVDSSMCRCQADVRDDIAWENRASSVYRSCNRPGVTTGAEVERCFDTIEPGTTVEGETSESGEITAPPASLDPCESLHRHSVKVHEHFHAEQGSRIARSLGPAFYAAWNSLRGVPDRLDRLRSRFPAQVAAFESQWNTASDWISDEVESYTWQRRFSTDVLGALHRICP